jgi:2-dehydro-3-deoxygluconokinase
MVELTHLDADTLRQGVAGDTYNAAVYLVRTATELGIDVEAGYVTGLGDDEYSDALRDAWRAEGIADRAVTVPGRLPGLYTIRTAPSGERRFAYWRGESAARHVLAGTEWCARLEGDVVHLSGITLQLTTPASLDALVDRLAGLRAAGSIVSLDTNYRPAGWPSAAAAAATLARLGAVSTVVLASRDDETLLHGPSSPERSLDRLASLGAGEAVLRDGANGAYVRVGDDAIVHLPAHGVAAVVDTTAAGDAFAGAYLAGRLAGHEPSAAAALANGVAAVVIQHPGAIAPRAVRLLDTDARVPPRTAARRPGQGAA